VLHERIVVPGQPIPLGRLDGGDALDDLDSDDPGSVAERGIQ
jgi:hypothetical protein